MVNGCKVTMFHLGPIHLGGGRDGLGLGDQYPQCGEPVIAYGLCEHHYAERIRLGGTP